MLGAKPDYLGCCGGRRQQLRRPGPSVSCRESLPARTSVHRRGAESLPDADPRPVPLRLRRRGQAQPLLKMHTLGHDSMPPPSTPAACATTAARPTCATWSTKAWPSHGLLPDRCFEAAKLFLRTEGFLPAPRPPMPSRRPSRRPGKPSRRERGHPLFRPWPARPGLLRRFLQGKLTDSPIPRPTSSRPQGLPRHRLGASRDDTKEPVPVQDFLDGPPEVGPPKRADMAGGVLAVLRMTLKALKKNQTMSPSLMSRSLHGFGG